MTDHVRHSRIPNVAAAWAWVGIVLSLALNVFAAWIVVQVVQRPDLPLQPPPAATAGAK